MIPEVVDAKYVRDFIVFVRFADGKAGTVDLQDALQGPMFQPLRNKDIFCQFYIHPEFKTLCWDNGADIAPEFLYEHLRVPEAV
ncbi:MAG: DUF2442 domain-containing protein [Desulfotignum sp.]